MYLRRYYKKARKGFETKINSEPIAELQTKEWKERTIVGIWSLGFGIWDLQMMNYEKEIKKKL